MMYLRGNQHAYEVGQLVAATVAYRLYLAKEVESNAWRLLQVAHDLQSNGGLSRAAYILDMLQDASHTYDLEYGAKYKGKHLHYDRLFPQRVETFVSEEQGNRRFNVLAFTDVSDVPSLLPLSNLRVKDRAIIDLKTGAWVMGRLLKLLSFTHQQGIAIRSLRPNNILLDKDQHFAIVLDWTTALVFQSNVSREAAGADIVRAAETVLTSYGATAHGLPYQLTDDEERYISFLRDLADGSNSDANKAHAQFYDLVREIWDADFHPFTTLSL